MTDIQVHESGESVTASPGDRIIVLLADVSGGTGYEWAMEDLPEPLELESSSLDVPEEAAPGAARTRRVVLRARGSGRAKVVLTLGREWEHDQPPTDRFEFDVTVR